LRILGNTALPRRSKEKDFVFGIKRLFMGDQVRKGLKIRICTGVGEMFGGHAVWRGIRRGGEGVRGAFSLSIKLGG